MKASTSRCCSARSISSSVRSAGWCGFSAPRRRPRAPSPSRSPARSPNEALAPRPALSGMTPYCRSAPDGTGAAGRRATVGCDHPGRSGRCCCATRWRGRTRGRRIAVPTPQGAGIARDRGYPAGRRCDHALRRQRGVGPSRLAVLAASLFIAFGRFRRRRQIDRRAATAAAAGRRRRRHHLHRARQFADRAGLPALDRARHPAAGRTVVCQSGQLHGRPGLDDGRRDGADHQRRC